MESLKPYGLVYMIKNLINDKVYIGLTTGTAQERWYQHKCKAKTGTAPLHAAIRKYGDSAFEITVLGQAGSRDELSDLETRLIEQYSSRDRQHGYNLCSGGHRGRHSAESKAKMSAAHRTAEAIAKTNQTLRSEAALKAFRESLVRPEVVKRKKEMHLGRKRTPDEIDKSRFARTGLKRSDESRARMRDRWRKWWSSLTEREQLEWKRRLRESRI